MTTLLLMGSQGSAMIVVVLALRALLLNRLPKAAFCALWVLVVGRLLVPLFVAAPFGLWALLAHLHPRAPTLFSGEALGISDAPASMPTTLTENPQLKGTVVPDASLGDTTTGTPGAVPLEPAASHLALSDRIPGAAGADALGPENLDPSSSFFDPGALPWWAWVWTAGSLLCACGFAMLYIRGWLKFRCAQPVSHPQATQWLLAHPLHRPLKIRSCERVLAPLTCGVVRPVILVPPSFDWDDPQIVRFVLDHEYAHITHFDTLKKIFLVIAVCVHWFNPLVWVMYVVANRDIELSCDARVARRLNPGQRASYARMLLTAGSLVTEPSSPLTSSFAKTSVEERVVSVVKYRPPSRGACIASAAVLLAVPTVLATTAPALSVSAAPPLTAEEHPGQTAAVLFGTAGEHETTLPDVAPFLVVNPSQLSGVLEESGYTYNASDQVFYKDGGTFGDHTGRIALHILGEPDAAGNRALNPDQLHHGTPVKAVTATLLFDDRATPFQDEDAVAALEFLEDRASIAVNPALGRLETVDSARLHRNRLRRQSPGRRVVRGCRQPRGHHD